MAWGGKIRTRMTEKQRKHFLKTSHRRLPPVDNPHGIPSAILEQLASETLGSDPRTYNARLQQLLAAYKSNMKG
jgi:hypothetical protein